MSVVRIECPPMPTTPTEWYKPWLRITAELPCDWYIDDVQQPGKVVFPPTFVRWSLSGIFVDAGTATDYAGKIIIDFPKEPVERKDNNTMRVLAVPVTGRVFGFLDRNSEIHWKEIKGMELPECLAHRDKTDRSIFIVDAVTLRGTI